MTTTTLRDRTQQRASEHEATTPEPWGDVTRVRLDEALLQTLESALNHPAERNRHRTKLLRAAMDPAVGCTLYLLVTYMAARHGDSTQVQGNRIDRYAKRRLLKRADRQALVTAMTQISRWVDGFPLPPTDDDCRSMRNNPQALVQAAYALAREMQGFECEAA